MTIYKTKIIIFHISVMYIKIPEKYKNWHPCWRKEPIWVLKEIRYDNVIYYILDIDYAGFKVKIRKNAVLIDEECKQLLRKRKYERINSI